MTTDDTIRVLAILRAGMPGAFLRLSDEDARMMVTVWAELFAQESAELVIAAAKQFMWAEKSGRFPSPGAIREQLDELRNVVDSCAQGMTLYEFMGEDAQRRFAPPVLAYIESAYRKRYEALNGKPFVSRMELAYRKARQLKGAEKC